jgi:hypothetical protein
VHACTSTQLLHSPALLLFPCPLLTPHPRPHSLRNSRVLHACLSPFALCSCHLFPAIHKTVFKTLTVSAIVSQPRARQA